MLSYPAAYFTLYSVLRTLPPLYRIVSYPRNHRSDLGKKCKMQNLFLGNGKRNGLAKYSGLGTTWSRGLEILKTENIEGGKAGRLGINNQ